MGYAITVIDGEPLVLTEQMYLASQNPATSSPFHASHNVRRFVYGGQDLVIKEPGLFASLINTYYAAQDADFLASRNYFVSGRSQINAEAEKLLFLQSQDLRLAPKLIDHNPKKGQLVREYIHGKTFRQMSIEEQLDSVHHIVSLVEKVHREGIAIGDAHVKNVMHSDCDGQYLWLDFDGRFDESIPVIAQANDVIKLVYSTFTESKDMVLTRQMGESLGHYGVEHVRNVARVLVDHIGYSPGLWWATRVSRKEHRAIKELMMDSLQLYSG